MISDAADYLSTESYVQMVEQERGAPPPHYSSKGLVVQFFPNPVLNDVKSFGGQLVLTLPGRDDAARKKKAEQLIREWECGAKLVAVHGKAGGHGYDDYEVEVEGAGRPIFDEVDYVFIAAPGDSLNVVRRPVWDDKRAPLSDVNRFAEAWRAYKAGAGKRVTGTMLEHWPVLTRSQVAELKAINVQTVEHLAELSDEVTSRFQGLMTLKQRAQASLDAAKGGAAVQQMATEKRRAEENATHLQRQVEELQRQVEELRKGIKK